MYKHEGGNIYFYVYFLNLTFKAPEKSMQMWNLIRT